MDWMITLNFLILILTLFSFLTILASLEKFQFNVINKSYFLKNRTAFNNNFLFDLCKSLFKKPMKKEKPYQNISFLCSFDLTTSISSTYIVTGTSVSLSSGHVTTRLISSPTDFARIFKNKYSISKVGKLSIFILLMLLTVVFETLGVALILPAISFIVDTDLKTNSTYLNDILFYFKDNYSKIYLIKQIRIVNILILKIIIYLKVMKHT